jgi:phosphodiesterase/alkaline phosphatase D-like protein
MKSRSKGLTRRAALSVGGLGVLGTAACSSKPEPRAEAEKTGPFQHGIASGDPLQTRVILWSCISDGGGGAVKWEIASDREMSKLVRSGVVPVRHGDIVPVKVDADGLGAGTEYFYRFTRKETRSDIGRTKTLPAGKVDQILLAVVSCSNHPAGYFHSYAHLAQAEPVDAVLALGDYIYEYGLGGFATEFAEELQRVPEPIHECVKYEDYATRYAQYHRDPDLQAAHLAAPWILTWDDHETANDSWKGGAQNHDPAKEGDWAAREAASLQAFYEWTPTREPAPDQPRTANYRRFDFGDLASLTMIETRLSGRSEQIDWDQFPVPVDADPADPAVLEKIRAFDEELVGADDRRMLGNVQAEFVQEALQTSVASGQKWQIIGNQTLFGEVRSPDYMETLPGWLKWLTKRKSQLFYDYFLRSRFHPLLNLDSWDGYPAARERFYDRAKAAGANLLVVTGDTHDFNAFTLRDKSGQRVGAELGTSGVSSPGNYSFIAAPGVNFGELSEATNPDMLLHDTVDTGYIRLVVTADEARAEYIATSSVRQIKWTAEAKYKFQITRDEIKRI